MTHFQLPGWQEANGHRVRSHMEASLCRYLSAAKEEHAHGDPETLSFQVNIGPRRHALFVPSILLTTARVGDRQIVVQPVDSVRPGGGVRRLQGFRKAHHPHYFIIVIARRALMHQIPDSAYDVVAPIEDFSLLDKFLLSL